MVLLFFLLLNMDMLIIANHLYHVNKLKILVENEFDIKGLGAHKQIFRMEIHSDKNTKKL